MEGRQAAPGEWLAFVAGEVRASNGIHYRALAAALRDAIEANHIPLGVRLPPQRELARLLGVGRTTVVGAYNLLRAEALVRPSQGAGTWVVARPGGPQPGEETCP
jgi:DNA-binding GntR family transcriptional regulator